MYKKTTVALAAVSLLALSVLSAPAAVASSDSVTYVGPYAMTDNQCASEGGLLGTLPCFDNPGASTVEVEIRDDSTLEVNGLVEFRDANGVTTETIEFCGNSGSLDVPSGTGSIRVSRYITPPPVVNGCTEVFWTTGTIEVTWD